MGNGLEFSFASWSVQQVSVTAGGCSPFARLVHQSIDMAKLLFLLSFLSADSTPVTHPLPRRQHLFTQWRVTALEVEGGRAVIAAQEIPTFLAAIAAVVVGGPAASPGLLLGLPTPLFCLVRLGGSQQSLDLLHQPPRRVQVVHDRLGLHFLPHSSTSRAGRSLLRPPQPRGEGGGGEGGTSDPRSPSLFPTQVPTSSPWLPPTPRPPVPGTAASFPRAARGEQPLSPGPAAGCTVDPGSGGQASAGA